MRGDPYSTHMVHLALSYLNVKGLREQGYGRILRVDRNLANYLFPGASSSLKAIILPSKPCQMTSVLVGRSYTAAGQAGGALHNMTVLQAYLLKELNQGKGLSPEAVSELRIATDLDLCATKQVTHSIYGSNGEASRNMIKPSSLMPLDVFVLPLRRWCTCLERRECSRPPLGSTSLTGSRPLLNTLSFYQE